MDDVFGRPRSPADYRTGYLKYRSVLHDPATRLPAFPVWIDRLHLALDRRRRLGVLQIEILNLDLVESLYGWQIFDRILASAATALRACVGRSLPESSLLATNTVSGDRLIAFVLEAPDGSDCDSSVLSVLAAAVSDEIGAALHDPAFDGLAPELVVRVGRAVLSHNPFYRFERRVYAALDEASRFVDRRDRRRDRSWGEELERIIRDGSVESVFQPLVDLQSRAIHGFEAFVRGPRDTMFETPRAMFSLSSRLGNEVRLDRTCLESALHSWASSGRPEPLFVNVLPEAVIHPEAGDCTMSSLVSSTGRKPEQVVLEFSERAAESDFEMLVSAMRASAQQGFQVALDDVGTGLHTREIVERLRPDYLKLDVSLVRGIDSHLIKRELMATVVDLALDYGSKVVAEGVENESEAAALSSAGAGLAQGFLFGRPTTASDAARRAPEL